MGVIDGTGLYHDAIKRIQQLEKLNSQLAAEVDCQRPVIEAAMKVIEYQHRVQDPFAFIAIDGLRLAYLTYEARPGGGE